MRDGTNKIKLAIICVFLLKANLIHPQLMNKCPMSN